MSSAIGINTLNNRDRASRVCVITHAVVVLLFCRDPALRAMLSLKSLVAAMAVMSVDAASLLPRVNQLQSPASLPNPYPLSSTPYSIKFVDRHRGGASLPILAKSDVDEVIDYIQKQEQARGAQHGNAPVGARTFDFGIPTQAVGFTITSTPPQGLEGITWNDTLVILDGFSRKMHQEGYRTRLGRIIMTETGVGVGTALLFPRHQLVGEDSKTNQSLQFEPAANPVPLPGTSLDIDFDEPGEVLNREDVSRCLFQFQRKLLQSLDKHGDRPLPGSLLQKWRSVEFEIYPMPGYTRVTLKDCLKILNVVLMKVGKEGSRALEGDILDTEPRLRPGVVAQVVLGPASRRTRTHSRLQRPSDNSQLDPQ
ncbi:MAG: hypothetical protein Q9213_005496 [Squamulea squamosa]